MREFDKILRGLDREALNALAAGLLEKMGDAAENVGQSPSHGLRRDSPLYTRGPLNGGFTAEENEEAGLAGVRPLQEQAEAARRDVEDAVPYGWDVDIQAGRAGVRRLREQAEAARRDVEDAVPYEWGAGSETSRPSPAATPTPQGEGFKSAEEAFSLSEDNERERMRGFSDFFRRDGRRYDGGFTRY